MLNDYAHGKLNRQQHPPAMNIDTEFVVPSVLHVMMGVFQHIYLEIEACVVTLDKKLQNPNNKDIITDMNLGEIVRVGKPQSVYDNIQKILYNAGIVKGTYYQQFTGISSKN